MLMPSAVHLGVKLTEQSCAIASSDTHQFVLSTWMKWEIRCDVVHFSIKRRPGIFGRIVLFEFRRCHSQQGGDAASKISGALEASPVERATAWCKCDFLGFLVCAFHA